MMPGPLPTAESTVKDFLAFIICPRKFQNVWKNQLPFGQMSGTDFGLAESLLSVTVYFSTIRF